MSILLVLPILGAVEVAIWGISGAAIVLATLALLMLAKPSMFIRAPEASHPGMAIGCIAILLFALSSVLAVASAVLLLFSDAAGAASWAAGLAPLAGLIALGCYALINLSRDRARARQAEWQRRMSVPEFLIVDDDDRRKTRLYNALRSRYPTTEMTLRTPAGMHWELDEHLPRARIVIVSADVAPTPDPTGLMNDSEMIINDIAARRPGCPVLLYGIDREKLQKLGAQLAAKGWNVTLVDFVDQEAWYSTTGLETAVRLLGDYQEPRENI